MSTKTLARYQYQQLLARAVSAIKDLPRPNEGWVRTVRKALGMSGSQLARRQGVTRALITSTEKAELSGRVTIKRMEAIAAAMGCRFVYAIVPLTSVEELIAVQARNKARAVAEETNKHMAMEGQSLHAKQIEFETARLAAALVRDMPRDLWDER
jgi:predicted DNA-binding mobile mystery protein A